MLKLELSKKNVNIRLRDRERLLNKPFVIALAIALVLHLFGALLFHIQPFRIHSNLKPHLPVTVDADLSSMNQVVAEIENKKYRYPLPPSSTASLPPIPFFEPHYHFEEVVASNKNPFQSFELEIPCFTQEETHTFLPIDVRIGGALANRIMLFNSPSKRSCHLLNQYAATYEVQVDNTGNIFWFQLLDEKGDAALEKAASETLRSLRFNPLDNAWITRGIIEIIINQEST